MVPLRAVSEMKIDGLPAIGFATIIGAVLGYYVAAHYWKTGKAH